MNRNPHTGLPAGCNVPSHPPRGLADRMLVTAGAAAYARWAATHQPIEPNIGDDD